MAFAVIAAVIAWAATTDGTLSNPWPMLAVLAFLAVCTLWTSISILRHGSVYHWLRPERRPRRWVLALLLLLFMVFAIWFPIWMTWPRAYISRALTSLFGIDFFVTGMTLKWFSPLVDRFVERRGWQLR
jgi:hypothetical protein